MTSRRGPSGAPSPTDLRRAFHEPAPATLRGTRCGIPECAGSVQATLDSVDATLRSAPNEGKPTTRVWSAHPPTGRPTRRAVRRRRPLRPRGSPGGNEQTPKYQRGGRRSRRAASRYERSLSDSAVRTTIPPSSRANHPSDGWITPLPVRSMTRASLMWSSGTTTKVTLPEATVSSARLSGSGWPWATRAPCECHPAE